MFQFGKTSNLIFSDKLLLLVQHGFGTRELESTTAVFDFDTLVNLEQKHGDLIEVIVGKPSKKRIEISSSDGVVTAASRVLLTVKTADCVPIVYVDQVKKIIGISHQGWRGLLLKLPQKMVAKFIQLGSKRENVLVVIGPSIGSCCYNIKGVRAGSFQQAFPQWADKILENHRDEIHLNLGYLSYLQLIELGLKTEQIDFFPFCTKCNGEKFWSYRRGDRMNRMISFVMKI